MAPWCEVNVHFQRRPHVVRMWEIRPKDCGMLWGRARKDLVIWKFFKKIKKNIRPKVDSNPQHFEYNSIALSIRPWGHIFKQDFVTAYKVFPLLAFFLPISNKTAWCVRREEGIKNLRKSGYVVYERPLT